MGNNNKIKKQLVPVRDVHKEVALLLEDELSLISNAEQKKTYILSEEYPKTQKNNFSFMWKNVWARLLICFAVVAAITYLLVSFVSRSNKNIPVEVAEFESMNLTVLLNKVNDIDNKIQEYEKQKKELVAERDKKLDLIEKKHAKALKNYAAQKIRIKSKRQKMEQEIEDAYRADLATVSVIKKKIAACNDEIKNLQAQRNEFDATRIQEAERQKAVLNNERYLHQKEIEKLTSEYNGKLDDAAKKLQETIDSDLKRQNDAVEATVNFYDPILPEDDTAKKIVRKMASKKFSFTGATSGGTVEMNLSNDASKDFKASLASVKDYYSNITYLHTKIKVLPHNEKRAVSSYYNAVLNSAYAAGNEICSASVREVNRIISEKNQIVLSRNRVQSEYDELLENLCKSSSPEKPVNGFIRNARGNVYVSHDFMHYFTCSDYKDFVVPCDIYRGDLKIGIGELESVDGKIMVVKTSFNAGYSLKGGDKVAIGTPYKPSEASSESAVPAETESAE